MRNTTDITTSIRQAEEACRMLSTRFLEMGRNRWIEIAINEGWTHNLRETARSIAFETWRRSSLRMDRIESPLTLADIDAAVEFNKEDHAYFRQNGRDINRVDLFYVCEARRTRNGNDYPILSNPPPSVTEPTENLVKQFKANMIEIELRASARRKRV